MAKKKIEEKTTYTKDEIIRSKKYAKNRDLLSAILADKKKYSTDEVELKIKEFMKRRA